MDIDNFIRVQTEVEPKIDIGDLLFIYNKNSGVFGMKSLQDIANNADLIGDKVQIGHMINLIKSKGENIDEVNVILKRKAINDLLITMYLKLNDAILAAHQLEKMALYLSEQSSYRSYYSTKIIIAHQISGSTYQEKLASLDSIYAKYYKALREAFDSAQLNIYEGVPNFELLTQAKCEIVYLNEQHTILGANCPIAAKDTPQKRNSMIQFADFPNGSKTNCLKGSVMANSDGTLSCFLVSPHSASKIENAIFHYVSSKHMNAGTNIPVRYDFSGMATMLANKDVKITVLETENIVVESLTLIQPYEVAKPADNLPSEFKPLPVITLEYQNLRLVDPKWKITPWGNGNSLSELPDTYLAILNLNYNGVDYQFSWEYRAFFKTTATLRNEEVYIQAYVSCISSYPECKSLGNRLQFTSADADGKNKKVVVIGPRWNKNFPGIAIPILDVNP